MKQYSVWGIDERTGSEYLHAYYTDFNKAVKRAEDGDVVRYSEKCDENWDWEVIGDNYEQWKVNIKDGEVFIDGQIWTEED